MSTEGETVTVKPEDARAFLTEFGHSADALKGAKDEDVVKQYQAVNTNFTKRVEAHVKSTTEKATKAQQEAAAANKTKWEKGEHKLELPKESALTQADVDEIAAKAREQGLSIEQAKEQMAARETAYKTALARQDAAAKEQRAGWVKTLQAKPDLQVVQANAQKAIDKFMPQTLRENLKTTGFGDYPPLVEFLAAIGAAMSEDKPLGQGGAAGGKKSAEEVLYGGTTQ